MLLPPGTIHFLFNKIRYLRRRFNTGCCMMLYDLRRSNVIALNDFNDLSDALRMRVAKKGRGGDRLASKCCMTTSRSGIEPPTY